LTLSRTENELLLDRTAHPNVATLCASTRAGANAVAVVGLRNGGTSADAASEQDHSGDKWN
jgi:hypothetical protein